MMKRVTIPAQRAEDAEDPILAAATAFIPEELNNITFDYAITDNRADADEIEVLLVAAKNDIVKSYTDVLRRARLLPIVADVDHFALANLHAVNCDPAAGRIVGLVNIGTRYSSINIIRAGRSTFSGDVPVGGRDLSAALCHELGLSTTEAEQLETGAIDGEGDSTKLQSTLTAAGDAVLEEIVAALGFFWSATTDERIDKLYVSGGTAHTPGLIRRLAERLAAPAELIDPFTHTSLASSIDARALRHRACEFAIAMGLAVRQSAAA